MSLILTCVLVYSLQVVGEAQPGHVFGEVGVLCYRPQLFTVRTKRLSQLLRLNRTAFLNLVQANVGDGAIIMNNLLQVGPMLFPYKLIPKSCSMFIIFGLYQNCYGLMPAFERLRGSSDERHSC